MLIILILSLSQLTSLGGNMGVGLLIIGFIYLDIGPGRIKVIVNISFVC